MCNRLGKPGNRVAATSAHRLRETRPVDNDSDVPRDDYRVFVLGLRSTRQREGEGSQHEGTLAGTNCHTRLVAQGRGTLQEQATETDQSVSVRARSETVRCRVSVMIQVRSQAAQPNHGAHPS